jgi:hypothetical protein
LWGHCRSNGHDDWFPEAESAFAGSSITVIGIWGSGDTILINGDESHRAGTVKVIIDDGLFAMLAADPIFASSVG